MSRHNSLKVLGILVAAIALMLSLAPRTTATEYSWTNASGSPWAWDEPLNWTPLDPPGPPGAADTANLASTDPGVVGTINLNGDRGVGQLSFLNQDLTLDHSQSYTIASGASTLAVDTLIQNGGVGNLALNEIQAKLNAGYSGLITIGVVDGTLKLSGQIGPVAPVKVLGSVVGGTLDIAGPGILAGPGLGNQMTADSRITVASGAELKGVDGNLSAATIELNGGKLSLTGAQSGIGQGLLGEYYRNMDTGQGAGSLGPGLILAAANGTGFDRYSPGGANYIGDANYQWGVLRDHTLQFMPGNPDPNVNIFAGILDHNGNQVDPRHNTGAPYEQYACRWAGTLIVPTSGDYRFFSGSDDGSKVWVDGAVLVNNDYWTGYPGPGAYGPTVHLDAGLHTFVVGFYEGGGGHSIDVQWNSGAGYVAVPASAFECLQTTGTGAFGNNVEVTNTGSEIAANSSQALSLGALKLNIGTSLAVSNTYPNAPVTFTATNLSPDGPLGGTPVLNNATLFNGGALMGAAGADQLTKIGAGEAQFTTVNSGSGAITLNANEGTLKLTGLVGGGGPLTTTINTNGTGQAVLAGQVMGTALNLNANSGKIQAPGRLGGPGATLPVIGVVGPGAAMELTYNDLNNPNNVSGTLTNNAGQLRVNQSSAGPLAIVLNGGVLTVDPVSGMIAGLMAGRIDGNGWDTTNYPTMTYHPEGLANMDLHYDGEFQGAWTNNNTWVYQGKFWSDGGLVSFMAGQYDDHVRCTIDGNMWIADSTWANTNITFDLALGWHTFEARFGQGGGGVGPVNGQFYGVGYDPLGRASGNNGDYMPIPATRFGIPGIQASVLTGPVSVVASSEIQASGYDTGLGVVSVDRGVNLTVNNTPGNKFTFAGTTLADAGVGPTTLTYNVNVTGGNLGANAGSYTVNKQGTGAANFGQLIVPIGGASVALNVNQGSMTFAGAVGVGGPLTLAAVADNSALTFQGTVTASDLSATAQNSGTVNFGAAVSSTTIGGAGGGGGRLTFTGPVTGTSMAVTANTGGLVQFKGALGAAGSPLALSNVVNGGGTMEFTGTGGNATGTVTVNPAGLMRLGGGGTGIGGTEPGNGAKIVLAGGTMEVAGSGPGGILRAKGWQGNVGGSTLTYTGGLMDFSAYPVPTNTNFVEPDVIDYPDKGDWLNKGRPGDWLNYNDNLAVLWTGIFKAPVAGTYSFSIWSDDESALEIDGVRVVGANCNQQTGTMALAAGYHTYRLGMKEGGGNQYMRFWWQKPGDAALEYANQTPGFFFTAYPNEVAVTAAGSVINGTGLAGATFGQLTMDRGTDLTYTHAGAKAMAFSNTVITDVGAPAPVGMIFNHGVSGGDMQISSDLILNKSGAGSANFGRLILPEGVTTAVALNISQGGVKFTGQVGTETAGANMTAALPTGARLDILHADPASPNNIIGAFQTNGGQLYMATNGTNSSVGAATITLNGGLLDVSAVGTPTLGIKGEFYGNMVQNGNWPTEPRATGPGRILTGAGANNGAGFNAISPGGASYNDAIYRWGFYNNIMNPGWPPDPWDSGGNPFIGTDKAPLKDNGGNDINLGVDNIASRWSSNVMITTAGSYYFRTSSDDGSVIWLDGVQVAVRDAWTGMGWTQGGPYTISAGLHQLVVGWYEGGGGAGLQVQYYGPDNANNWTAIPDNRLVYTITPSRVSTPVAITASSTINVSNQEVTLGGATVEPGITLTSTGTASLKFTSTTFTGTDPTTIGYNTGTPTYLGQFDNGSRTAVTVLKTGTSDLVLDQTDAANAGLATTFKVAKGRLIIVGGGANDPLGGAAILVDAEGANTGGTIGISSKSAGPVNVNNGMTFNQNSGIEARILASGTNKNVAVNVTSVTIAEGKTVAVTTGDGYSLNLPNGFTGGSMSFSLGAASSSTVGGTCGGPGTVSLLAGGPLNLGGNLTGGKNIVQQAGTLNLSGNLLDGGTITQNGGTFNMTGGMTGGGAVAVNSGAVMNVDAPGSLAGGGAITIGGRLNANAQATLGATNNVLVKPAGILYLNPAAPAPTLPTNPNMVTVQAAGILWGDVTNAYFSGAQKNVDLLGNSIIVPTAGVEPTPTELPSPVWRGVTDSSGTYSNLGTNRSYQGVIFDSRWSPLLPQFITGLNGGRFGTNADNWNTGSPASMAFIPQGLTAPGSDMTASVGGGNGFPGTWVFQGKFYWEGDGAGGPKSISFAENFDDNVLLKIDNAVWLNNTSWSTPTNATQNLGAGYHDIEIRFADGGGGAGPVNSGGAEFDTNNIALGLIIDPENGTGWNRYVEVPLSRLFVGGFAAGYSGTLQEDPDAPDGFTVQVNTDMFFNNAKIDAASGHAVKFTGSNKLTLQDPWLRPLSTANTFVRIGTAPTATDPGTMGKEIVEFWPAPALGGALPSASSLTISNGLLALDGTNQGAIATDQTSTINMAANSYLFLDQDVTRGTWNIMKDAWVRIDAASRLTQAGTVWNIESGAWAVIGYDLNWNTDFNPDAVPLEAGLNLVVGNGTRNFGGGLRLANAGTLATGWNEAATTIGGALIQLEDQATGFGPIRITSANGLTINNDLNLTTDGFSNADLIINATAADVPWLPKDTMGQGNTGVASQFIDFQKKTQAGTVNLFGTNNMIGGLTVANGKVVLGNDLTDTFVIQGPIVAKAGAALQHNSGPGIMNDLAAGTLGTGIEMQGGTTLTQELRPLQYEDPDNPPNMLDYNPQAYAEQFLFNAVGSSAMSIWHLRNLNGNVNQVYQFPNVKMDSAYLQVERENFNVVQLGIDVTGLNRLRRTNEPHLLGVTGNGELRVGSAAEGGYDMNVWGPIGGTDPTKIAKLIFMNGTIYMRGGSGMTAQGRLDLYRPDLADYAGANLDMYAGDDGTPAVVAGSIFNTGGGRSVIVRTRDGDFGLDIPFGGITNNFAARLNVTAGQGYLRSARGFSPDTAANGTTYFSNVHLAPGTSMHLETNDGTFAVANITLDGQKADTFTYTDGGDENRRWIRDVIGTATDGRNTLHINSGGRREMGGMLTNTIVSIDQDAWARQQVPSPGVGTQKIDGFGLTNSALTLTHPMAWSEIWYMKPGSTGELNAILGYGTDGGRATFYIHYGQLASNTVGEAGWGSGLTVNLDNGGRIDVYADRYASGQPVNVNKFDARINILNGQLHDIYNNNQWWANARIRADRNDPNDANNGAVRLGNIHMTNGSVLHVSQGEAQLELRQVYLDGDTGTIMSPENAWVRVFKVNGTTAGTSTLNVTGNQAMQFMGALTKTNVVWKNTERMEMDSGFAFTATGNKVTMMPDASGYQGWAEVRTDPGTGTFETTQTVQYNWWRGRVDFMYGELNTDLIGEGTPPGTGWGNNITVNVDGGQAIRLYANGRANADPTNLNILNARINVGNVSKSDVENVTGGNVHNAMFRSEQEAGGDQVGWSVFTNVHMADGAELAVTRGAAEVEVRNLYLDGPTAGYINWGDWTTITNVIGTQPSPSALNIHNGNWMYLGGKLTNANVTWSNNDWLGLVGSTYPYRDLPVGTHGFTQPGFEMAANASLTIASDRRLWLFTDPKAGTINYTTQSMSEGESYFRVGYGNAKNDCPGDAWGSNLTINLDSGRALFTYVDRPAAGEDNINEVDARINIGNHNPIWWFGGGSQGGSGAGVHGRIRAIYTGTNPGGAGGFVYYSNVHLAQGTVVSMENDNNNVFLRANLTLDGTEATARINDDWEAIRDLTGSLPGPNTLHMTCWSPIDGRTMLLTGAITNTDISIEARNRVFLMPGMTLNGNKIYRASLNGGAMWVDGNPGTGTLESLFGYTPGDDDRRSDVELRYGRLDTDTVGDNGWGSGLTVNLGGGTSRALLRVMRNGGFTNVNKFDGRINIVNNVDGQDARIWGGRTEGTPFPGELLPSISEDTGGQTPLAWFTNIHLGEGSLTRLESWDANMRTDFYLEGNASYGWWNGQGAEKEVHAYNTSGTPRTLTFSQIDPGDWPVDTLNVTLHGLTDFAIDSPNSTGARTITSLNLNGRSATILRTSNDNSRVGRDWAVELRPEAPDPNGTIYLTGYNDNGTIRGGDFEIRVGRSTGSPSILPLTNFEISNGRMLRTMVARAADSGTPVSYVASPIHITGSGLDIDMDGMLAACESDGDPGGGAPGIVVYKNVTLDDYVYLSLQSHNRDRGGQGDTKIVAGGWGPGEGIKYRIDPAMPMHGIGIVNDTTVNDYTAFVGNVGPEGATLTDIAMLGARRTTLVGSMTANNLYVGYAPFAQTGRLEVAASAALNVTGVNVADNGELILRAPYPAAAPLTVGGGSKLVLGNATFAPASLTVGDNVQVQLEADAPWTAAAPGQTVAIGTIDYAGTLTVNDSNIPVGAINTDAAGIITQIQGSANLLQFRDGYPGGNGNLWLKLGNDSPTPIISDVDPVTPRSILIDRNLALCAANDYTGTTTIASHTTRACNVSSLGTTGDVQINGGATLELRAAGLSSGNIYVNDGATLALYQDTGSAIVFNGGGGGGGWITAPRGDVTASGALTENGQLRFNVAEGRTLTFTNPLDMQSDRNLEVASGTVLFTANVTGAKNIAKQGLGTLRLEGNGNLINSLAINGGGVVITQSPLAPPEPPATPPVTVGAGTFYCVAIQDHPFSEVDMANSSGILALGDNSAANLTITNANMSLGAYNTWGGKATWEYSGTLTPFTDNVYRLGGGSDDAAIMISTNPLEDVDPGTKRNVQIAWPSGGGNDPMPKGLVILSGANTFTGTVEVYGPLAITTLDAVKTASAINVNAGGSIDLRGLDFSSLVLPGLDRKLFLLGGGVASHGATLTAQNISDLFPNVGQDYILGGGGGGGGINTTYVEAGALSGGASSLVKVGTDTVELLAGANTYGGGSTTVDGGRLTINTLSSLGSTSQLTVRGNGVAQLMLTDDPDPISGDYTFNGTVSLADKAELNVAAGKYLNVVNGLTFDRGTPSIVGPGATVDTGVTCVQGNVPVDLTTGVTFVSKLGNTDEMGENLFKIRGGATLRFSSATGVLPSWVTNPGIGWMYPGARLEVPPDVGIGSVNFLAITGTGGLRLDVDQAEFDAIGQAAFSSEQNPYIISVGSGTELDFWTRDGSPLGILWTPVLTGECRNHRPVAWIQKEGGGELWPYAGSGWNYDPNNGLTRLVAWIIQGGKVYVDDGMGLGPDAAEWLSSAKNPGIATQHLEAIIVKDGATLAWHGEHGFLSASEYGGLPVGEGDGWNPGEFVLEDNAILTNSSGAPLVLGIPAPGTGYPCWPTIRSSSGASVPNVTITGSVTLRSGLDVDTTSQYAVPGGKADVTVSGNVKLGNDVPGNPNGLNVIRDLRHTGGVTTISAAMPDLRSMTVETGTVQLSPTATIQIGTNTNAPVDLTAGGNLHVTTGVTDMSKSVITSSSPPLAYVPGLSAGRIDGNAWDTTNYPAMTYHPEGISAMDVPYGGENQGPWTSNNTWVYKGEFYWDGGNVSFAENFDDNVLLTIDGVVWLIDTNWANPTLATKDLSAGWHNFEARFGQGGGGVGGDDQGGVLFGTRQIGLGYDTQGRNSFENGGADFTTIPVSRFRTETMNGIVTVDAGATLKAKAFRGLNKVDVQGMMVIGTDHSTSTTRALVLAQNAAGSPTATLDITNGALAIDYSGAANPLADVQRWIAASCNNKAWDQPGITSSNLQAGGGLDPNRYAIGYADNATLLTKYNDKPEGDPEQNWFGTASDKVPVALSSVLVKTTYAGDVNLDGLVDDKDVTIMVLDYGIGWKPGKPAGPANWQMGDVAKYDGLVDDNDITLMALNYGAGWKPGKGAPMSGGDVIGAIGSGASAVPEPATLALLGLGGLLMLVRRRRPQ